MSLFSPSTFDEAMKFLIADEGDTFTDDPDDSGGPTKFGVTQKAYSRFLGFPVTSDMMKALTFDDVVPFYRHEFWTPLNCNRIKEAGIATAIFDTAVLYGITQAGVMAQQTLNLSGGLLRVDGLIGDRTIELLNQIPRSAFLNDFKRFVMQRIDHLVKTNPRTEKFRQGWENRARRLLTLNQDPPFNKEIA
jgi:lysozyme family protein